jgi:hypothetical protein
MLGAMTTTTLLMALVSFLIGCIGPIMYYGVVLGIQRIQGANRKASIAVAFFAFIISFGLCSVGIVYLSTVEAERAPIIVVAFMIGLGLVRWLRNEL